MSSFAAEYACTAGHDYIRMLEQDMFYTYIYGKQVSCDCTVKTNMLPEHQTWCSNRLASLTPALVLTKTCILAARYAGF